MRIDNNSKADKISDSKKSLKNATKAGVNFNSLLDNNNDSIENVTETFTPNITNFFLLQELADGESSDNRKAKEYADKILNYLEAIRNSLLLGKLKLSNLRELKNIIDGHNFFTADQRLKSIIEEIELRASVEIAKLEKEGF